MERMEGYLPLHHSAIKTVVTRLTGDFWPSNPPAINNGNYRKFNKTPIYTLGKNGEADLSFPTDYRRVSIRDGMADTDLGIYRSNELFEKYAKIVADPWKAEPCGVATGSPVASQVFRAYAQGTFSTGTAGFGGIQVAPVMSNDAIAITTTDTSYTGSTLPLPRITPVTGQYQDSFTQLPYTTAAFAPTGDTALASSVVGRVVAMALRVTNTTNALNRGGKIRLGQTPFGTSSGQMFGNQQDLTMGNAVQEASSDRTLEIRWQTNSITDLDYNYWDSSPTERVMPLAYKNNSEAKPTPNLYAMVNSGGISPTFPNQNIDYQVVIVVEYAGYVQTGIPISGATRKLNDASLVLSLRQAVTNHLGKQLSHGDDPVSWLTRQGDRLLATVFGRPIKDPTGRQKGSTMRLANDVAGLVLGQIKRSPVKLLKK